MAPSRLRDTVVIEIESLGPVRVTVDRRPAAPELLWRKNLALLIYLARSPKHRRTRAHLTGLLWPEKDESAARHSLNEALRTIRKSAPDGMTTDSEQVTIAPHAVWLDVDELDRRVAVADWSGAAALVLGEFLEGFAVAGADEFERWLSAERSNWRHQGTGVLCRLAEQLLGQADLAGAQAAADRALRLDPFSDAAIGWVIRALTLQGNRSDALARFDDFARRTTAELGIDVGRDLKELIGRVTAGTRRAAVGATADADPLRRPPLVGRAGELSALLDSWRRTVGLARSEVGLITAIPGYGRSRLLEEAAGRIALDGAVLLRIRAVPADRTEPLAGLLTLATAGLADAPGVAATPPEAIASLVGAVPQWAERFGTATPASERWSVSRAFSEAVRSVAVERPVAILVDDAHWLDDESLTALEALARDSAGFAVWIGMTTAAGTNRDPLDRLASQLGRDLAGTIVEIGPLGAADLSDLIRWAFPGYLPTDVERLARRIGTDSAGVPLLAVELVYAVAHGMQPGAAAWPAPLRTLDQSLPGDLPPELVAAFRVSYRRLSEAGQNALAALAVLGDREPLEWIAAVAGLDADPAQQALDALEWSRWVDWEPRGYAFVARIAREVVRQDMLTPGQRRRLETRAAERRRRMVRSPGSTSRG